MVIAEMPSFISFIPTAPEHIKGFLNLVTFSPSDIVYDLGCGDGRLLFAALEKGAGKGVGVEIDPEPLKVARVWARKKGLEKRVKFYEADILKINLLSKLITYEYFISEEFINRLAIYLSLYPGSGKRYKEG